MIKKTTLIQPEKYYSVLQLHHLRVIKWLDSYSSLKRLVKRDIAKGNVIFNVIKTREGNGTRYLIKGSAILTLLQETKKGKIF